MKSGLPIHIDGPVDPEVIRNAMEFSRVWELWQPTKFRQVSITSSEESIVLVDSRASGFKKKKQLVCFSGGVDSTHMLLDIGIQEERGTVLTIHGMEIHYDKLRQFEELTDQTQPILDHLNYDRVTVRTNANKIGGGHHSWALSLAGNAFIFRQVFDACLFASDFTAYEDFISFPYGSNSLSNTLLKGYDYQLQALCNHVSRVEKLASITENQIALHSMTFCKQKNLRPQNCGVCDKCIRTKIMFVVATGHVPRDLFINPILSKKLVYSLDFSCKIERTFFMSTCQLAREKKVLLAVPGLEQKLYSIQNPIFTRVKKFFRRGINP